MTSATPVSPEILNIKSEISLSVVVRNILYDLGQSLIILRELPVFHPVSDHIAENPAEVLMSRVGQEASGVCQHPDKTGKISQVCQGGHLILHSHLVIVEPPGAALLYLGHCGGVLETAQDAADGLVIVGI